MSDTSYDTRSEVKQADLSTGKPDIVGDRSIRFLWTCFVVAVVVVGCITSSERQRKNPWQLKQSPISVTCSKVGQVRFLCREGDDLNSGGGQRHCVCWFSSKVSHQQCRVICQLYEADKNDYENQTLRKTDDKGLVWLRQCCITRVFSFNSCAWPWLWTDWSYSLLSCLLLSHNQWLA